MLVQLRSYEIGFLKVERTHLDNVTGSQITPACLRLNGTWTGQNNLHMIGSPLDIFDPELEQHKFVEESC